VELLDVAGSGAVGRSITLSGADVAAITAGSDFDRGTLGGLGLAGTGHTLFIDPGANALGLQGVWGYAGGSAQGGRGYYALMQGTEMLMVRSGGTTTLGNGILSATVAGDADVATLVASGVNAGAGSVLDGALGDDVLVFSGTNAYTATQVKLLGGEGADTLRVSTAAGQYTGAVRVEGGAGDDLIETGHVEGSRSADSGLYGGAGDDTLRVLDNLNGVGVLGNGAFTIDGGEGDDRIELQGVQHNVRGSAVNMVEGGAGFDTLVWNARYDLNVGTNQTGVDASAPRHPTEIGVRGVELLDVAGSGAVGRSITLSGADVAAITAGSDFDRGTLGGLGLVGTGHTLFVQLGSVTNVLTLNGAWTYLGDSNYGADTYSAYVQGEEVLLVQGGSLGFNASTAATREARPLSWSEIQEGAPTFSATSADTLIGGASPSSIELASLALDLDAADLVRRAGGSSWTHVA
jgi:hypothetical protein